MKIIEVGLSKSSIEKAIKDIEQYQKKINDLIPTFFEKCADAISNLANRRLSSTRFEEGIIADIESSWKFDKENLILENTSNKAVYVEFGVGQVGGEEGHPAAQEAGYQYNIPSNYKRWDTRTGQTVWWFSAPIGSVDIIDDDKYRLDSFRGGKGVVIKTAGQPATMFLFNAVQDFIDSEKYKEIWKELIKGL